MAEQTALIKSFTRCIENISFHSLMYYFIALKMHVVGAVTIVTRKEWTRRNTDEYNG